MLSLSHCEAEGGAPRQMAPSGAMVTAAVAAGAAGLAAAYALTQLRGGGKRLRAVVC